MAVDFYRRGDRPGDHGVALPDLDSAAVGDPRLDVGHVASYLGAAVLSSPSSRSRPTKLDSAAT